MSFRKSAAVLLIAFGCAAQPAAAPRAIPRSDWEYSIRLEGEYLHVEGTLPTCAGLVIEPIARRHVEKLVTRGRPCSIQYRFALFRAARVIDDVMIAAEHEGAVIAPASTWLMRPPKAYEETRFRVRVDPASRAVLGLETAGSHTYEGKALLLWKSPLAIFGAFREKRVEVGGGEVVVAIAGGELEQGDDVLFDWIGEAARDVTSFYGRFPVPRVAHMVLVTRGDELGFASTLGSGGASIVSPVGRGIARRFLKNDWQMTHELTHLAFPNVPRKHHWLEEGIATYVEPLARARRGRLSVEKLWKDLYDGLPKGQPARGDRGLDHTHTWGRTYWGGALFCFVADVGIRMRTENRRSLDDALRAILDAGGDIRVDWPIEQVIEVGDRATGVPVLAETYAALANKPKHADLESMFAALGVSRGRGGVELDDRAPLAYIRRSMTATTSGALGHR
jgi:hypothetical protein